MLSHQLMELDPLYLDDYSDTEALGLDCDQSAADLAVFAINLPCVLEFVGGNITETCGGDTTTPIFKFDLRPIAGSDTGRGDGDCGVLELDTIAAGKFALDTGCAGLELAPGNEIVCQLTQIAAGTGAAGHIRPCVGVRYRPETWVNLDNVVDCGE